MLVQFSVKNLYTLAECITGTWHKLSKTSGDLNYRNCPSFEIHEVKHHLFVQCIIRHSSTTIFSLKRDIAVIQQSLRLEPDSKVSQ